jgi:hypothetical protein
MENDPLRWLDDPELGPALESLRASASGRTELPPDVRLEVRSRIQLQVTGLGAGGSLESLHARDASSPASVRPSLQWLKTGPWKAWLIGGGLAGGAAIAVPSVWHASRVETASPIESSGAAQPKRPAWPTSRSDAGGSSPAKSLELSRATPIEAHVPEEPRTGSETSREPTPTLPPTLPAGASRAEPATKRFGPKNPRPIEESNLDLNYEITLLRLARASLNDRPAFARELLTNYNKRFPNGSMRREYEILLSRLESPRPSGL